MNDDPDERPPPGRRPRRAPFRRGELAVRNLQRRRRVNGRELGAFLHAVAEALEAADRSATLALVGDERMRELNREFRGLDEPTDVLSFGSGAKGESAAATAGPVEGEARYLGDIVVSVETAERQAKRRGSDLGVELKVLALHGFLHLLGYDHETDEGEMRRVEYRLRRRFGITRPRSRERSEAGPGPRKDR